MGRKRGGSARIGLAVVTLFGTTIAAGLVAVLTEAAHADTSAFEAYCAKTNIGDIGLPGTSVAGSLSPSPVAAGGTVTVNNLAISVSIPAGLVQTAFFLGNTQIAGYVSGQLDVSGGSPASMAVGGPTTAPTTQYSGVGAFSAAIPSDTATNPQPLSINIPLTAGSITAASSGSVTVSVHSSLTVFDLVNPGPPATYLPLTCSPVTTTTVGTIGTAIAQGGSGPLTISGSGLSQAVSSGSTVMITDGTHQAFATTSAAAASGSTSLSITTAAGGAWTAKYSIGSGNSIDLLSPTDEQIATDTISSSGSTPSVSPTPSSVTFTSATDTHSITLSGSNWKANLTSSQCTVTWAAGTDTGMCTTDSNGNLTGSINASEAGEQGTNTAAFSDDIIVHGQTTSGPATANATVSITPFTSGGSGGSGSFLAYCPQTNIGDIGLPGTTVSGTLSPASVSPGGTVSVDNLQISVTIPTGLVTAAEALGNTEISGYVSGQLDVLGGTVSPSSAPNTASSIAIGGPSTAPTSQYSGAGAFTAPLPTPAAAVPINIPLTVSATITAGSSSSVEAAVHSSLSVFDLINASPVTYLPLTCSPVAPSKVGSLRAAIALGGSGPLNIASPGVSASIAAKCAVVVTHGSNQAFATTSADVASTATSIAVTTASGGPWTAKTALSSGDEVDVLDATDEQIGSSTVTGGTGSPGSFPTASCAGPGASTTSSSGSGPGGSGSGSGGASPATAALANTGTNKPLWLMGLIGFLLVDLGYLALTTVDRPRQLVRRLLRASDSGANGSPGDNDGVVPQS